MAKVATVADNNNDSFRIKTSVQDRMKQFREKVLSANKNYTSQYAFNAFQNSFDTKNDTTQPTISNITWMRLWTLPLIFLLYPIPMYFWNH